MGERSWKAVPLPRRIGPILEQGYPPNARDGMPTFSPVPSLGKDIPAIPGGRTFFVPSPSGMMIHLDSNVDYYE